MQENIYINARSIASYYPKDFEFNTLPIINKILQDKKLCLLPVTHGELLHFAEYNQGQELKSNRFSIQEPTNANYYPILDIDVVLVPLLACDRRGYRVGTGGGYYDKTFAFIRENNVRQPLLVGIGYQLQLVDEIPSNDRDVRLHAILTEKEFRWC